MNKEKQNEKNDVFFALCRFTFKNIVKIIQYFPPITRNSIPNGEEKFCENLKTGKIPFEITGNLKIDSLLIRQTSEEITREIQKEIKLNSINEFKINNNINKI